MLRRDALVLIAGNKSELVVLKLNAIKSCSDISYIDESLHRRRNCFRVVQADGKSLYFSASDIASLTGWVTNMKRLVRGGEIVRLHRHLLLRIIEGRDMATSSELYIAIYYNGMKMARTNSRKLHNGTPFWREEFAMDDIGEIGSVELALMSRNTVSKDSELGRVVLTKIGVGAVEAWYPFLSTGNLRSSSTTNGIGDLKIRVEYEQDVVLPLTLYARYFDVLSTTQKLVAYDLTFKGELEYISELMLSLHDARGQAVEWIKLLIDYEVNATEN